MGLTVGINGFGRIGRNILRALLEQEEADVDIVAINDLATPEVLAHLLQFDSVHGRLNVTIEQSGDILKVGGQTLRVTALRNPEELPWDNVDVAFECTGLFTCREKAKQHLSNGSKRVLVSAPCSDADRTVVFGVNDSELTANDHVVSNASCTTNCLAPVAMVLNRAFGIKTGYMTTIHAFTGDQPSHDAAHKDPYRARAASLAMVPTSTGAARALSLVLPQLKGKLEGSAVRVPVPNVSMVDLVFLTEQSVTSDDINQTIADAASGELRGILAYEDAPTVSIDYNHNAHSACFAPAQTSVTEDGLARVVAWYDNEWGFSNRMIDTGKCIGNLLSNA